MYASNYLEAAVLNAMRGQTFTAPSAVYVALYLSDPGEAGTSGTEVSYSGYQRQTVTFSEPATEAGGIGFKNISQITFPTPEQAAGTIQWIAIMDSQVGGNQLCRAELTEPLTIGAGEPPVFLPGDIFFYLTGNFSKAFKTRILNTFRGTSLAGFTPHFALYNGDPESGGSELSGDNYARVSLAFSSPAEQESGQLMIQTSKASSFNRPTTDWGNWSYSAIYDAASSGNPIATVKRATAKDIKRGYMPTIAAGAVKIGLN